MVDKATDEMEQIEHRGRLQFITHKTQLYTELQEAELALKGGCRWIQLRMKNAVSDDIIETGRKMRELCDRYDATLIIDDHVELVKEISADGVHLGLCDMPVDQARRILGEEYIIGATANTPDEALMQCQRGADYLGCGPFRFTTTKEKLAKTLGLEGLAEIMRRLHDERVTVPVVAVGGITLDDIDPITATGVDGIAVSGAVINASDPVGVMHSMVRTINEQFK